MEQSEYEDLFKKSGIERTVAEINSWKPLLRQCMICIGIWYIYFMLGLYQGAQTVLIAQIRREANSTQAVTDEMSSWLGSTAVMSSLLPSFILPWLFQRIGRKFTHLIVCITSFITYTISFFSTNLNHVLISLIFLGIPYAATNLFEPIIIAEYTSPKYRGIFLTVKSVSPFWGIWVANVIGTFFYWKYITVVSFLCSVYIITVIKWPESPYWLAVKGRYLECAQSHRWLKGVNVESEQELAQLIISQKQSRDSLPPSDDINNNWYLSRLSIMWSTIRTRSFYKPTLLCILLYAQYHFTGKFVIAIYAIDVLKSLTQDESVAYRGMLILDGVTVFSMYMGCILSRYLKRRVLLFFFASIGNLSLYVFSLYLFLISLSLIPQNNVVIIFLLCVFSIATGCGPMILASSIYGEIVPAHYQTPIMLINNLSSASISSTLLKIAPFLFKALKMHGCFLFFAMSSTIIIIILYINLPETKDKTIQELSEYYTGKIPSKEHYKTLLKKEELK